MTNFTSPLADDQDEDRFESDLDYFDDPIYFTTRQPETRYVSRRGCNGIECEFPCTPCCMFIE